MTTNLSQGFLAASPQSMPERLYHGTYKTIQGSALKPFSKQTVNGRATFFLYASQDKRQALIYTLGSWASEGPHIMDAGFFSASDHTPYVIIGERERYLKEFEQNKSRVLYSFERTDDFMHSKTVGEPLLEWASQANLPLDLCQIETITSPEQIMQTGVNIYFLAPGKTFGDIQKALTFQQPYGPKILQMVDQGILTWENRQQNIYPDLSNIRIL